MKLVCLKMPLNWEMVLVFVQPILNRFPFDSHRNYMIRCRISMTNSSVKIVMHLRSIPTMFDEKSNNSVREKNFPRKVCSSVVNLIALFARRFRWEWMGWSFTRWTRECLSRWIQKHVCRRIRCSTQPNVTRRYEITTLSGFFLLYVKCNTSVWLKFLYI